MRMRVSVDTSDRVRKILRRKARDPNDDVRACSLLRSDYAMRECLHPCERLLELPESGMDPHGCHCFVFAKGAVHCPHLHHREVHKGGN